MRDLAKKIAVIGAAGKMGRGIALLLLQEMACDDAQKNSSVGKDGRHLVLVDRDEETLFSLRQYFRPHLTRFAEKSINQLRTFFFDREDLVSNEEMIREFVEGALDIVRPALSLEAAKNCSLVFEAIVEDLSVKSQVLKQLKDICPPETYFFTNTSSIPISRLAEESKLEGRLVGAHFYNPPPVQKLLEIIYPETIDPKLKELAIGLGSLLKKKVVVSRDVPGFIGNGHFIREIAYACDLYEKLKPKHSHIDAILMVDAITRDYLLRPMGMFQLLDYVGLDVWKKIVSVMGEQFSRPLIEKMIEQNRLGGQEINGSQKEGFFQYRKGKIVSVYDFDEGRYVEMTEGLKKHIETLLEPMPERIFSWKELMKVRDKETKIKSYEQSLDQSTSLGSQLAKNYIDESRKIAQGLVTEHVAQSLEDVHTVLKNGFYHILV